MPRYEIAMDPKGKGPELVERLGLPLRPGGGIMLAATFSETGQDAKAISDLLAAEGIVTRIYDNAALAAASKGPVRIPPPIPMGWGAPETDAEILYDYEYVNDDWETRASPAVVRRFGPGDECVERLAGRRLAGEIDAATDMAGKVPQSVLESVFGRAKPIKAERLESQADGGADVDGASSEETTSFER